MTVVFKNKGFVHIPKTGGRTIGDYLKRHVLHTETSIKHFPAFPTKAKYVKRNVEYFICVRRPEDWLASFHTQVYGKGFKNRYKPIFELYSLLNRRIDVFIQSVVKSRGAVGRMFEDYMLEGRYFVGHTETLSEDFSKFMGEDIILPNHYNSRSKFPAQYRDDLRESERTFIEKYYADN